MHGLSSIPVKSCTVPNPDPQNRKVKAYTDSFHVSNKTFWKDIHPHSVMAQTLLSCFRFTDWTEHSLFGHGSVSNLDLSVKSTWQLYFCANRSNDNHTELSNNLEVMSFQSCFKIIKGQLSPLTNERYIENTNFWVTVEHLVMNKLLACPMEIISLLYISGLQKQWNALYNHLNCWDQSITELYFQDSVISVFFITRVQLYWVWYSQWHTKQWEASSE